MGRPKDPALERLWRNRLRQRTAGGLTIAAFCSREGVSVASYYYWRRRLATEVQRPSRRPGLFVPVRVPNPSWGARSSGPPRVDVELPGGVHVRLPDTPEPEWLARLVAALALPSDREAIP
jgi:transposase